MNTILSKGLVIVLAAAFATASFASNGMFRTQFLGQLSNLPSTSAKASSGNLVYYGGPVIAKAKVMTVFWGAVPAQIKTEMPKFYEGVVGSDYLSWMNQYNTHSNAVDGRTGTNQDIGTGSYNGTFTITPSFTGSKIDDTDIHAELEKQIAAGNLPPADADTLYMIHFGKGLSITFSDGTTTATSCQQFCAYHGGFKTESGTSIYYGVMPDLTAMSCSFGCGMGLNAVDRTTAVSAHELAEAITDPFPTPGSNPAFPQAWNTTDGYEIGDLCQSAKAGKLKLTSSTYVVTSIWDNSKSTCSTSDWTGK